MRAPTSWRIICARLGVGPETVVGVCAERSPEMLIAFLAILKAGGAYLPLDPNYPPDRLAYMLSNARVPVLLSQAALLERFRSTMARIVCLDADWPASRREPTTVPVSPSHPESIAYVIYTSGSTGRPKGAMVTHRGMLNHLLAKVADLGLGPQDASRRRRRSASTSRSGSSWWRSWSAGACTSFPTMWPPTRGCCSSRRPPAGVTILEVVPSFLLAALDSLDDRAMRRDWPPLRWLVVTRRSAAARSRARLVRAPPRIPLVNAYGPTECSDDVDASAHARCRAGSMRLKPRSAARF